MNSLNIDGPVKWKTCVLMGVTIFLTHLLNWWYWTWQHIRSHYFFWQTVFIKFLFFYFILFYFFYFFFFIFLHKCFCWDFISFSNLDGNLTCKIHAFIYFKDWWRSFSISHFISNSSYYTVPNFSILVTLNFPY